VGRNRSHRGGIVGIRPRAAGSDILPRFHSGGYRSPSPIRRLSARRPVANSRSARKRIRANERKHVRNRAIRSSVRTKVGKARRALVGLDETIDSQAQLLIAVSALDRAAEKGVLHPNNAARRKARLMTKYNRALALAQQGATAPAVERMPARSRRRASRRSRS